MLSVCPKSADELKISLLAGWSTEENSNFAVITLQCGNELNVLCAESTNGKDALSIFN